MSRIELERAEDLLRQGRYPEAIDRFRELLSMEPERADLRGRVAEAYRLAGNRERAFHHFHKAAGLYARQQDLLGAARMLEAANQVSPNEPDVLYRLAEVLKKLGKARPLQTVLRSLVKAAGAPGDRRRLWALDELVHMNPNDLDAQVERAKILLEVGRLREAVLLWQQLADHVAARGIDFAPWLEAAAKAAPEQPEIGVPLARLLLRHGHAQKALALLVPYYEQFPDDVPLLEALLEALRSLGAKDKILPAQLELLKARTRGGQRAEALEEVKGLLREAPMDPRVLEVCAHACVAFGLTGEACRIWFDLAGVYDRHDMSAQRDRVVLRILETKPDHEGALELGARVLRVAGRDGEAQRLEAKLDEVRARSSDELPVFSSVSAAPIAPPAADVTATAAGLGAAQPQPQGSAPRTMVLDEDDVVEVEEVIDSFSDVFDTNTPAFPTHEGRPQPADLARDDSDDTATGEMPAVTTDAFPAPSPRSPIRDPFFSEAPEAVEEITSRMDEHLTAELEALRAELEEDEATATAMPAQAESPRRPEIRSSSRANARLVSDLLQEVDAGDKP